VENEKHNSGNNLRPSSELGINNENAFEIHKNKIGAT
jgi:hypothetical protein